MNTSKHETKTASERVDKDARLRQQREIIRDLHELLKSYGPPWYTEEMDSRLRKTLSSS